MALQVPCYLTSSYMRCGGCETLPDITKSTNKLVKNHNFMCSKLVVHDLFKLTEFACFQAQPGRNIKMFLGQYGKFFASRWGHATNVLPAKALISKGKYWVVLSKRLTQSANGHFSFVFLGSTSSRHDRSYPKEDEYFNVLLFVLTKIWRIFLFSLRSGKETWYIIATCHYIFLLRLPKS